MEQRVNTIELTDEELSILNSVIREHKVTATTQDLVMLQLGKSTSPLLALTMKIGSQFENRQLELAEEAKKAATPVAADPQA